MHPGFDRLSPYPFETLAQLFSGIAPNPDKTPIDMTIGGPKMPPPEFALQILHSERATYNSYPPIRGTVMLRETIAAWLQRRFAVAADPSTQILALGGTREGLFSCVQALVDRTQPAPLVALPNPFYKIYEGAALLAGAELHPLNATAANGFLPDLASVPDEVWARCQILFLCTPNNPTGAVLDTTQMAQALELAHRHDFYVISDECYSELYPPGQPPASLLQACITAGYSDYSRALVFHSLSKRSSLAGLRSGFVAGDTRVIGAFARYRSYHGVSLSLPVQAASAAAWGDEDHVTANRQGYDARYAAALQHLDVARPPGGFYLWVAVPGDDCAFAVELYRNENVQVLPGSLLGIDSAEGNPGAGYLRISLVDEPQRCGEGARRIAAAIQRAA